MVQWQGHHEINITVDAAPMPPRRRIWHFGRHSRPLFFAYFDAVRLAMSGSMTLSVASRRGDIVERYGR